MIEKVPRNEVVSLDPAGSAHSSVSLYIERLVIDGVALPAGGTALLQAAVESEMSRLIATGGLGPELVSGAAMPSLRAPGIQMSATPNPSHLGLQIARAVYGGLRDEKPVSRRREP